MVYSLLATDLDGTLLNRAAQISEGNISALQRCGEQGIVRVAATGRSYYSSSFAEKTFPTKIWRNSFYCIQESVGNAFLLVRDVLK